MEGPSLSDLSLFSNLVCEQCITVWMAWLELMKYLWMVVFINVSFQVLALIGRIVRSLRDSAKFFPAFGYTSHTIPKSKDNFVQQSTLDLDARIELDGLIGLVK